MSLFGVVLLAVVVLMVIVMLVVANRRYKNLANVARALGIQHTLSSRKVFAKLILVLNGIGRQLSFQRYGSIIPTSWFVFG